MTWERLQWGSWHSVLPLWHDASPWSAFRWRPTTKPIGTSERHLGFWIWESSREPSLLRKDLDSAVEKAAKQTWRSDVGEAPTRRKVH
ncbi:hypothetical protein Fmac_018290 [Flemingia macrophylla]|uniref:Uncharacterized protein n=1 Tax=Flemingia macrophylla TaxID=520843 RepID=A0ABD1M4K1_9FABA